MKKALFASLFLAAFLLARAAIAADGVEMSEGQTVYVPVYSHIYMGDREIPFMLTATLSIRNTDPARPISLVSVQYRDSGGKVLKSYVAAPVQVPALSATRYVVAESDEAGGSGAFFLVRWKSAKPVNAPIMESIMIGTRSQQGLSFTSRGRAIQEPGRP